MRIKVNESSSVFVASERYTSWEENVEKRVQYNLILTVIRLKGQPSINVQKLNVDHTIGTLNICVLWRLYKQKNSFTQNGLKHEVLLY